MKARLFIRKVGAEDLDDFDVWGDVFWDDNLSAFQAAEEAGAPKVQTKTAVEKATAEGEGLCRDPEHNVEAFQVWTLHSAKRRKIEMEDI